MAAELSFALALLIMIGVSFAVAQLREANETQARAQVTRELGPYANGLTASVHSRFALLAGLHEYVTVSLPAGPTQIEFETFAAGLGAGADGVRAIQVAPKGIVDFVYPLEGNLPGNNLLTDKRPEVAEDVQRTLESDGIITSGPYELRQGGLGIVGRQTVRTPDGEFWGFAIMVLDVPPILEEAGLAKAPEGLRYALRDHHGRVFAGEEGVFEESPVTFTTALPDGAWELAAVPEEGWAAASGNDVGLLWGAGAIVAVSIAALAYGTTGYQRRLKEEVAAQTAAVHKQRDLFERVTQMSPVGIAVLNTDGVITLANSAAEEILGLARAEVEGRTYEDHRWRIEDENGDPFPIEELPFARVKATGSPVFDVRHTVRWPDGERRFLSVNASPLRDANGALAGVVAAISDVTEREAAERAVRESERRLRTTLDCMIEGCQILSHDWVYLYVNDAAEKHNRRPKDELLGNRYQDIWPGIEETEVFARIRRVLEERVAEQMENEFRFPDGRVGWFDLGIQPVPEGVLILSADITERHRVEEDLRRYREHLELLVEERTRELADANEELQALNEELQAVNEELDASNEELQSANAELEVSMSALADANSRLAHANKAKSDFLASMSHELRTPLNSIIGFSDLLARGMVGELDSEQEKQVSIINAAGKHLLGLINQVLDLAKIEAGQIVIDLAEFDASEAICSTVESLAPLAEEKGLELECETGDVGTVVSDQLRMTQVLFNLVGNAIKFTDSGAVRVSAFREDGVLTIHVSDTGRGIPKQDLPHVFEEFYQVAQDGAAKPEGTGLGLAVSRRLAEALGGSIAVESTLGTGTTFAARIPIA